MAGSPKNTTAGSVTALGGIRNAKGQIRGRAKNLLSPEQERAAREMFADGGTKDEIARAAGVTRDTIVQRFKDQLSDLAGAFKERRGEASTRRPRLPTEYEIFVECAKLRRDWGPDRFGILTEDSPEGIPQSIGKVRLHPTPTPRGRWRD